MQGLLSQFVQSILDAPGEFVTIAMSDPLSAILIVVGALLVGVASAVFGYLSLGAVVSLFMRPGSGRSPPRADR
ncbi:hypothetical protein [Haloarcula nitratireducens]|uniref:Uncharacterized protein n=1 Tax=Haloarcula nitratireducens TaxID=2487749 RepID=A0AAW4PBV5_9EURY|nr:hypothetical protein [Halomicroarcula nitratireducens]MBX0295374.1 hypothetical protein [Halomicroarcula nitratireducens]